MEDSLKGILITVTIIGLFMTAILNFIVIFPQEQGISFSNAQDNHGYLTMAQNNDSGVISNLQTQNNQSENSFNQWDVTTGFMGTNQLKQGQSGIKTSSTNIISNLKIIATELFTQNSPIFYLLTVLGLLSSGYLIYAIIKFVRTGN